MSLIANSGKGKSFHHDHDRCLKDLLFYENEIEFFKKELDNVSTKHMDNISMLEQVKEYNKILSRKEGRIKAIREDVRSHEHRIAEKKVTDKDLTNHELTMDEFNRFVADFEKMKKNFKRFASHND